VAINSDQDIVSAVKRALWRRNSALNGGRYTYCNGNFRIGPQHRLFMPTTAKSRIKMVNGLNRQGISVIATDDGPGTLIFVRRCEMASPLLEVWDSGLPGVRRLMDEFESHFPQLGKGTTVAVKKWRQ